MRKTHVQIELLSTSKWLFLFSGWSIWKRQEHDQQTRCKPLWQEKCFKSRWISKLLWLSWLELHFLLYLNVQFYQFLAHRFNAFSHPEKVIKIEFWLVISCLAYPSISFLYCVIAWLKRLKNSIMSMKVPSLFVGLVCRLSDKGIDYFQSS